VPLIHDVEIWNEANSPTYWPQSAGPEAYAKLLAHCYDVLHSRPFPINVISSTASRHDPAAFIFRLSDAFRALGRTRSLFDTFGHNPYGENSAEPPWTLHAGTDLIAEGDYETLMNVLHTRVRQHRAAGAGRPWRHHLVRRGRLPDGAAARQDALLPRPRERPRRTAGRRAGRRRSGDATQGRDPAYCQPAVSGFLNFGLLDEDRLGGWRSGLLYRDGTRKPSYDTFKAAIAEARRRDTDCSKVRGAPQG
jgi:hypothetical protein